MTILKKHNITADEKLIACKDGLKQALQAKAQRRTYNKRSEQYKQNEPNPWGLSMPAVQYNVLPHLPKVNKEQARM